MVHLEQMLNMIWNVLPHMELGLAPTVEQTREVVALHVVVVSAGAHKASLRRPQ